MYRDVGGRHCALLSGPRLAEEKELAGLVSTFLQVSWLWLVQWNPSITTTLGPEGVWYSEKFGILKLVLSYGQHVL